jgi:hypothetical protein
MKAFRPAIKAAPSCATLLLVTTMMFGPAALAADVKITPLGSQQGEFCQLLRPDSPLPV